MKTENKIIVELHDHLEPSARHSTRSCVELQNCCTSLQFDMESYRNDIDAFSTSLEQGFVPATANESRTLKNSPGVRFCTGAWCVSCRILRRRHPQSMMLNTVRAVQKKRSSTFGQRAVEDLPQHRLRRQAGFKKDAGTCTHFLCCQVECSLNNASPTGVVHAV